MPTKLASFVLGDAGVSEPCRISPPLACPDEQLSLRLVELIEALRARGLEPVLADQFGALHERLRALDSPRRARLDEVAASQVRALVQCIDAVRAPAGPDELARRDAHVLRRSISCVVNASAGSAAPVRERIELHYSHLDLAALVQRMFAPFEHVASERRIEVVQAVPDCVAACADAAKLQCVLLNLLFNAFRYTPPGGSIHFELLHESATGEVAIRIIDSGPGIAPERIEAIFARREPWDQDALGGGDVLDFDLGATRDYVALHGGSLRVASSLPGRGAEFQVRLPARPPAGSLIHASATVQPGLAARAAGSVLEALHLAAEPRPLQPPVGDRPLVLLVEDSHGMQRIMARALAEECRTVSAFDGRMGVEGAMELHPDLIVVDLELPSMSARTVIQEIRRHPPLADVPIMAISGERDPSGSIELLRRQVQDVLRKPFSTAELQARVQNLMNAKRARDMLGALVGKHERDLCTLAAEVSQHQRRLELALGDLRVAREAAESASRVKSNFLRMMSHELKTPVTAMMLQLQILMRPQILTDLPDEVAEGFYRLQRSIARLVHLVDTILEWARVESGRCQVASDPIELNDVTASAVRDVAPQAIAKELSIDVTVGAAPERLIGDARLIRLITVNLLERAVKITEEGQIRVEVASHDGWASVSVSDGAPVISRAEEVELFDPLQTAGDLRRRGGAGSGLGLHVVRDLARAIGGDLRLAAPRQPGSTIDFLIPRAGNRKALPAPSRQQPIGPT
jgi:signal transduction histidine kinase